MCLTMDISRLASAFLRNNLLASKACDHKLTLCTCCFTCSTKNALISSNFYKLKLCEVIEIFFLILVNIQKF